MEQLQEQLELQTLKEKKEQEQLSISSTTETEQQQQQQQQSSNNNNTEQQQQQQQQLQLPLPASSSRPTTPTPTTPTPTTTTPLTPYAPQSSRQLLHDAALAHGGLESMSLQQQEMLHAEKTRLGPRWTQVEDGTGTLEASVSRNPSTSGGKHGQRLGHRRVEEGGEVTYKKIQSKQIMGSIQLGIHNTVGKLASKPKRDLLMNDFWEVETITFPAEGSALTPAHHYSDFRFKVYAPIAFRYFRDLFNIAPDDFLMSMAESPMRELSNPGASGSIFYLTEDDEFILKTVQKKECEFLQKLLPGYYMNLSQNPRTLLPKFFGLYCFHYNSKNVRLVAMNNLLPSDIKMHCKYDLKGSTFRRKASKAERQKASPTFKDLDFAEHHPNGIFLESEKYTLLMNTIRRDCMVLESFQIMDYSLLVGIHNLDIAAKEKREERIRNARAKLERGKEAGAAGAAATSGAAAAPSSLPLSNDDDAPEADQFNQLQSVASYSSIPGTSASALNRTRSMNRQRLVAHSTAMESITADLDATMEDTDDMPMGGIPARSENDERLILYIGIIDILQSYRLEKKLEHTFKSILYNGDTVSVCRPSFYAKRFQDAMAKQVFKKTPTFPLKHSPSKRKTSATQLRIPNMRAAAAMGAVTPVASTSMAARTGAPTSTPPPAFDDISEEDITAAASTTTLQQPKTVEGEQLNLHPRGRQPRRGLNGRQLSSPYSYDSSIATSDDYDDDDDDDDDVESRTSRSRGRNVITLANATNGDMVALSMPLNSEHTRHSLKVTTVEYVEETAPTHVVSQAEVNGKPAVLHATTRTTHIQGPSFRSTLLVQNDVPR